MFSSWYFGMVFIILATSLYQEVWMKKNGFKLVKKTTFSQRFVSWLLVFVPIFNTIFGLMCIILLLAFVFYEDIVIKAFEESPKFKKICK